MREGVGGYFDPVSDDVLIHMAEVRVPVFAWGWRRENGGQVGRWSGCDVCLVGRRRGVLWRLVADLLRGVGGRQLGGARKASLGTELCDHPVQT